MENFNKNLQDSVRGILYVIKRPAWLAISLLMALLISTLIYFSVNIGFYGPLFLTLSFFDSLSAIGIMTVAMVQSYFADLNGVLLLVVSLLQGVAIAIFIFTSRKNKKMDVSVVGRSGFALIFATLGLGCVPCGTSLLIPVMTLIFSSSAPALLGTANAIVLSVALFLTIFSLYKIGTVAYKYKISEVV